MALNFLNNATFTGSIKLNNNTTTPTDGSAYLYKSSAGAVVSGFQTILETGGAGSRVTALTIDSSQNSTFVGSVTVQGDGIDIDNDVNVRLRFDNASAFKAGLQVATTSGDMIAGSAINDFAIRSQGNMLFASGGNTERMRIDTIGKVGIGTINPDALLHVESTNATGANFILESTHSGGIPLLDLKGAASAQLRYKDELNVIQGRIDFGDSGTFNFIDVPNNKSTLYLKTGGDVGIGTTTPAEKLDVNGRVRIGDVNYAYGGSNYHILLAEDSNDAYISNINGYGILSAGGYYYGGNLRKLNSTSTAYSGIQTRPDGAIIFESATGGTAGDTISATEKMRISSNGSIQFAAYNSSNNIGTATYLLGTDVSGNVVKTSAAPSANFNQGAKTHAVGTAFSNVLTVALSSHQGCYVTLCCFGDWGGHSSAAYRGEFFLQNGAGVYNEPGIIIRQDDNTSDGTDQIICQILDPGGSTGSRNFIIQIRHTDTTSPATFTGTITFTVQGQFNSVT